MDLVKFIKGLSEHELRVVMKRFRKKRIGIQDFTISKTSSLFYLIVESPPETLNDEYMFARSGMETWQAYKNLKTKLLSRILDRMGSDTFILNDDIVNGIERIELRLKQRLYHLNVVTGSKTKGQTGIAMHIVDEVLSEAMEYELYNLVVEALTYKKLFSLIRKGYGDYEKMNQEIAFYKDCMEMKSRAGDFYLITGTENMISHVPKNELENFILDKIRTLEGSPFSDVSFTVQYFIKAIYLKLYDLQKDRAKCFDTCLSMLTLLNDRKAIAKSDRYGYVYASFCDCLIRQRKFKEAANAAVQSFNYLSTKSFNYIQAKEQEFFACFYMEDYIRSWKVLEVMLARDEKEIGKFRKDLFKYYSGWLHFVQGNFKESLLISRLSLSIQLDKPGWVLGMRYLEIMSCIELKRYAEARDVLESLRKKSERHNEKNKVEYSGRDKVIHEMFNEYSLCGFEKRTTGHLIYLLRIISPKKEEEKNAWSFATHELIPIHQWVKGRIVILKNTRKKMSGKKQKK